jgi:Xaa-Pro dipeptidase
LNKREGLPASFARLLEGDVREPDVAASATSADADVVRYFRVDSAARAAAGARWPPAMDRVIAWDDALVEVVIRAHHGHQTGVNCAFGGQTVDSNARVIAATIEAAMRSAVDACRAGNTADGVYLSAARVMGMSAFAVFMGPMTGHGIGREATELPCLHADDRIVFEPGMVFCVEPSIFTPARGGATIEQEVIIQPYGAAEVITPTPTQMW